MKRVCTNCGLDFRPDRASQGWCENCLDAQKWIEKHSGALAILPISVAALLVVAMFGPGAKVLIAAKKPHTEPKAVTQSIPIQTVALLQADAPASIAAPVTYDMPKITYDTYTVHNPKPKPKPKVATHTTTHYATAVSGVTSHSSSGGSVSSILAYARAQIGESYVLGGAGPAVWDCSGLTLMAFNSVGVSIGTHSATNQFNTARARGLLVPYADKRPGDLIFYTDGGGDMYHVAIYSGNGKSIEAANPVAGVRERTIWGSPYYMVARFT